MPTSFPSCAVTAPKLCRSSKYLDSGYENQFNILSAESGSNIFSLFWKSHYEELLNSIYMCYCPSLFGQDGWILAKFFFRVFMDRDGVEVHILQKNERGQYPAILTKQAWAIKGYPIGRDSSILPARVANRSARFGSSCPLTDYPYNKNC